MPELPEVETVRRDLIAAGLPGRWIRSVEVGWERSVGGSTAAFTSAVVGHTFGALRRRGKYLILELHGREAERRAAWLVVHLRMSGRLFLCAAGHPRTGYERAVLALDDGRELRFHDPRKFGRMLVQGDIEWLETRLGVEPLSAAFTPDLLIKVLRDRKSTLKPFLLAQHPVAGLGNIYVDEALFRAGIHPLRAACSLSTEEVCALHRAIRDVLELGVANLGTALGSGLTNFALGSDGSGGANREALQVFRRTGLPCPRCGSPIERIVVGGRSTHICVRCQPNVANSAAPESAR